MAAYSRAPLRSSVMRTKKGCSRMRLLSPSSPTSRWIRPRQACSASSMETCNGALAGMPMSCSDSTVSSRISPGSKSFSPRASARRWAGSMVRTKARRPSTAACRPRAAATVVLPTPPGPMVNAMRLDSTTLFKPTMHLAPPSAGRPPGHQWLGCRRCPDSIRAVG